MDEYSLQMHKVCMNLFKLKGANLGVDPDKLCSIYQDGIRGIRMNYYPPCQQADKVIGLTPHSDATRLTMLVQIMSNGEYGSIEHRAVVDSHEERLSIAAFHGTNFTAKVGPLADLVKEIGAQYKTIETESLLRLYLSSKLDGKSLLDHMRINK
ncbi:S-norcoclaurine synthase 1-like [Coffea eugenioides]|uniref:Oxoglutarate-dependent flavonoid 7-O-demethylase 1-like n=1 Tax=Coffea arabica TaxID=13443 RepID=A0A6P6TRG7_COFAR|nr:S-norcoclaurine synthase 1-like [Coffea arabica]XP_027180902.1 S-norcoclaurine synthase 1-like [Coffea eugenioides]